MCPDNIMIIKTKKQLGFSLLEIIATLVMIGMIGALLFQYLGTNLSQGSQSVADLQTALQLQESLEKINADYKKLMTTSATPLTTLQQYVTNGNDPSSTPYYGEYTSQTKFIQFDANRQENTTPGGSTLLKVTISKDNRSLTTLFSQ